MENNLQNRRQLPLVNLFDGTVKRAFPNSRFFRTNNRRQINLYFTMLAKDNYYRS